MSSNASSEASHIDEATNMLSNYDVSVIVKSAKARLDNNDIDGAERFYQEALLNWVDEVREGSKSIKEEDLNAIYLKISNLWIAYATFFEDLGKITQAIQAYENATQCPIAGGSGNLFLSYAKFLSRNKKPQAAQKIFLRALVGSSLNEEEDGMVRSEAERKELWNAFLELVQKHGGESNLTLEELQNAVDIEHVQPLKKKRKAAAAAAAEAEKEERENDESKKETPAEPEAPKTKKQKLNEPLTQDQIEKAKEVEQETNELLRLTNYSTSQETSTAATSELVALWLTKDGGDHPLMPPLLFQPSPPKLNDMSGRELVGTEVALQIICMLQKLDPKDMNGSILLDICHGCWGMTFHVHQQCQAKLVKLDEVMNKELQELDENLLSRANVALGTPAESSVQQANHVERNDFITTCRNRRQAVMDEMAWEFRYLLATQQQLLTAAKVPGFQGVSVDFDDIQMQIGVCAVLHSAFFIRSKVGEESHLKHLQKLEEKLMDQLKNEQENESQQQQHYKKNSKQQRSKLQQQQQQQQQPFYKNRKQKYPPQPQIQMSIPTIPPYQQQLQMQLLAQQQQQQYNMAMGQFSALPGMTQQDYQRLLLQQQIQQQQQQQHRQQRW